MPEDTARRLAEIRSNIGRWGSITRREFVDLFDIIDERDRQLHDVINALGHAEFRLDALTAELTPWRLHAEELIGAVMIAHSDRCLPTDACNCWGIIHELHGEEES